MKAAGWATVLFAARLLDADEREAVLGDLEEIGETSWRGLIDILGLVARRQAGHWKNWRPWLAAFGLALPCSFALMGFSVSVSRSYLDLSGPTIFNAAGISVGHGLFLLLCNLVLLGAWSWTGGFVIGSLSRRTLWVSAAASFLPCLFCLARFRIDSLSRLSLLLFLPPAFLGVHRGLRTAKIKLSAAIVLAVGITLLTIAAWNSSGPWTFNWALSWPAWFLLATSLRSGRTA